LTDGAQITFLCPRHPAKGFEADVRPWAAALLAVFATKLDTAITLSAWPPPEGSRKAEAEAEKAKAEAGVLNRRHRRDHSSKARSFWSLKTAMASAPRRRIPPAGRGLRRHNVKTTARNGKATGISQVSKNLKMLISRQRNHQIESKTTANQWSAQGVRLLNMEPGTEQVKCGIPPTRNRTGR
jgi:hypothetical protein